MKEDKKRKTQVKKKVKCCKVVIKANIKTNSCKTKIKFTLKIKIQI